MKYEINEIINKAIKIAKEEGFDTIEEIEEHAREIAEENGFTNYREMAKEVKGA